jgi:signal transduction histidine kinase
MVRHFSKLFPTGILLAVTRERGAAFWARLSTLSRCVFPRLRGSLRVKFIVLIVSLQLGMMGAIIVVLERHQRAAILEQARWRALSLALSLTALSAGDLLNYNFIKLEQTAEKVTADDRAVLYAVAHLHDGSVAVFSGRGELQGTRLDDPVSQQALQATAPLVQELPRSETMERGYDVAIPVFVPHSSKKWGTIRLGFSLRQAYEQIYRTRRTLIALSFGVMVCSTSLAIVLALRVSRPIGQLVAGVQAYARGSYNAPLRVDTHDEFGYLAHAFEQMRTSLQRHLTGLDEANRRLHQTQQQLMESEQLATVGQRVPWAAHEINNPLAVIKTAVRIIKNQSREDDPTTAHLQAIDEEVSRIARILRDLLDSPPASPTEEVVDVNAVIYSLEPLLAYTLQGKQIALSMILEPRLPQVHMASDRFKQVLFNIIRNAEEAMPGGGRLVMQTARQRDSVQMSITDTGCGIPTEHLGHVFDAFFTTKGHESGRGLGLAVSYRLIKGVNGCIEVESEVNKGSTFRVSWPVCKP